MWRGCARSTGSRPGWPWCWWARTRRARSMSRNKGTPDGRGRDGDLSSTSLMRRHGEADLLALIAQLNADPAVHGILVQLPLPGHLDSDLVINAHRPGEGCGRVPHLERRAAGHRAEGDGALHAAGLPDDAARSSRHRLPGMNAVVVGRSNIVGKPMAQLLLGDSCTVTIAHSPDARIWRRCAGGRTFWWRRSGGRR